MPGNSDKTKPFTVVLPDYAALTLSTGSTLIVIVA